MVGLRAGLLTGDPGRAAVPGRSGQAGRPGRAPRRAARPARPRPRGAARPADREPRQPGRADRPRGRGAPAPRGRAVLRRGRRAARPVREDRGPPRLGRAPQARGADPVPGGRRGATARGHRAKIGNMPHARPGPSRVTWGRQAPSLLRNPREDIIMALFMDAHTMGGPVTLEDVAKAHAADLQTQDAHGVHYLRYWVEIGRASCRERVEMEAAGFGGYGEGVF